MGFNYAIHIKLKQLNLTYKNLYKKANRNTGTVWVDLSCIFRMIFCVYDFEQLDIGDENIEKGFILKCNFDKDRFPDIQYEMTYSCPVSRPPRLGTRSILHPVFNLCAENVHVQLKMCCWGKLLGKVSVAQHMGTHLFICRRFFSLSIKSIFIRMHGQSNLCRSLFF